MTAATTFPWRLQFAEAPHPTPLPERAWNTLTVSQCVGLSALEHMLASGMPVGPVLVCTAHLAVHIPVSSQYEDGPTTQHTPLRPRDLSCPRDMRFGYGPCPGRFWILPPHPIDALTDFPALFDALHLVRCGWSRAA